VPLTELSLENVGPFKGRITFTFDRNINVLVGPNNSGKSTALMAIGDLLIHSFQIPGKLFRPGKTSRFQLRYEGDKPQPKDFQRNLPLPIAFSKFWTDKKYERWVCSVLPSLGYCIFVPAIRRSTDFRATGPTTRGHKPDAALEEVLRSRLEQPADGFDGIGRKGKGFERISRKALDEIDKRKQSFLTSDATSTSEIATVASDSDLIQKMVDLDYKSYRESIPGIKELFKKITVVASDITEGFPIEFDCIKEDDHGLVPQYKTPSGDLPLGVLSQGTQSIIQWLGRLFIGLAEYNNYPTDLENLAGILVIDEIDAHLHPSWQRRILPALSKHFPRFQVFCSTHSPLMLAGLKEGQVQLLTRSIDGTIDVSQNQSDIIGWSADEILRRVQRVTNPTDAETDRQINRLQELDQKPRPTRKERAEKDTLRRSLADRLSPNVDEDQLREFRRLLDAALGKGETSVGKSTSRIRREGRPERAD
jgi:energy-coupling factor transporter ATP-binding protein EcfA2